MTNVSNARFRRLLTPASAKILEDMQKLQIATPEITASQKEFLNEAFQRYTLVAHDVETNMLFRGSQCLSNNIIPSPNHFFPTLYKTQCESAVKVCHDYYYGNLHIEITSHNGKASTIAAVLAMTLLRLFARESDQILKIRYCANSSMKVLPSTPGQSLDVMHVNSGFSTQLSRMMPSIHIWRSEELLKVVAHETIHSISADRLHIKDLDLKKFQSMFALNQQQPLLLEETYTEILALLYHCFAVADHSNVSFLDLLNLERTFAIFQTAKLLRHFCIMSFSELMYNESRQTNDIRFRETTNAFCYHVLKSAVLYNILPFLKFVSKNDAFVSSTSHGDQFIQLITDACADTSFRATVDACIHSDWSKLSSMTNQTLRMTAVELKLGK